MIIGQARRRVRRAAAAALLGTAVLAAGCGGGGGGSTDAPVVPAADTTAPTISSPALAPASVRFTGGRIAITADVADSGTVSHVWAVIIKPDSSSESVDLAGPAGSTYSGSWNAPGNAVVGGPTLSYSVRVYARDASGNTSATSPMAVSVEAVEAPPPMPTY